jgi:two-component system cell cycle response regulator CpdR
VARILLAEDDDSLRAFLARALERAGHEVLAVGDGLSAMTALVNARFDLLVADIVMPGMDGIELARRAGATYPDLRIMLITGFAALVLQARQNAPTRARVFTKPIHLRDLVNQVGEVLAA